MKLSKRAEYGLRAIVALARLDPQTYVQSKDLARCEALPTKFLEAILLTLRRGEFLESKVGAGGGYRLARPTKLISVGELIRRLEGRLAIKDTSPTPTESSPGPLAVRLVNDKLTHATDSVLDEITLDHIAKASAQGNAMYYI